MFCVGVARTTQPSPDETFNRELLLPLVSTAFSLCPLYLSIPNNIRQIRKGGRGARTEANTA